MTTATNQPNSTSSEAPAAHEPYARWLLELWQGDYTGTDELIDDQFVGQRSDKDIRGTDVLCTVMDQTHAEVRSLRFEIVVGPLAQRDLVAARRTGHGEAGGAPVTFAGNDILGIRAGKIAEYWVGTSGR